MNVSDLLKLRHGIPVISANQVSCNNDQNIGYTTSDVCSAATADATIPYNASDIVNQRIAAN